MIAVGSVESGGLEVGWSGLERAWYNMKPGNWFPIAGQALASSICWLSRGLCSEYSSLLISIVTCLMLSGKIEESEKLTASFPGRGSPTSEHEYTGRDWLPFLTWAWHNWKNFCSTNYMFTMCVGYSPPPLDLIGSWVKRVFQGLMWGN